jgi:hypothetical protein
MINSFIKGLQIVLAFSAFGKFSGAEKTEKRIQGMILGETLLWVAGFFEIRGIFIFVFHLPGFRMPC